MTKIVGILNITPDSFSDGGKFNDQGRSLKQLQKMIDEGSDLIDIGAESTRPGSKPIGHEEEIDRLSLIIPQIVSLVKENRQKTGRNIELSLDSYHFETIKWVFDQGFDMVNDVSGLRDDRIVEFVAEKGLKTVLMHSEDLIRDENLVFNSEIDMTDQILDWAHDKIEELVRKGVGKSQLIFDPGVGFNKDNKQSIRVLKNVSRFQELGVEIYIGHSKKRFLDDIYSWASLEFIDELLGDVVGNENFDSLNQLQKNDKYWQGKLENKDEIIELRAKKTLLISQFLIDKRVDYLRVHDVKDHVKLL